MGSRGGRKKKKKRDKDGELGSNIKSHGIEKETFPTSSSYESSIESLTTSREDLLTEILHADKTIDGMTATQPFQVETSEEHNFLGFGKSRKRKLDKLTDKRTPTLDTSDIDSNSGTKLVFGKKVTDTEKLMKYSLQLPQISSFSSEELEFKMCLIAEGESLLSVFSSLSSVAFASMSIFPITILQNCLSTYFSDRNYLEIFLL
ncbi:hypothetical protein Avbf_14071 [Armadillidium vulgare]|nr:hypothetical protein Avbf_14071 [Armadillidium vulgare]